MFSGFSISDAFIILAAFTGPIAAVQAQKWIELRRRKNEHRDWVFTTLMTTRGARISTDHVRALNMITMAFHDGGRAKRSTKCQSVFDAWREYLDHLSSTDFEPMDHAQVVAATDRRDSLFVTLLAAIADERGFQFDNIDLKKGGYHPNGMISQEDTGREIMANALQVLSGRAAIRVQVGTDPLDEASPEVEALFEGAAPETVQR